MPSITGDEKVEGDALSQGSGPHSCQKGRSGRIISASKLRYRHVYPRFQTSLALARSCSHPEITADGA